jgi:hypothetical protein
VTDQTDNAAIHRVVTEYIEPGDYALTFDHVHRIDPVTGVEFCTINDANEPCSIRPAGPEGGTDD